MTSTSNARQFRCTADGRQAAAGAPLGSKSGGHGIGCFLQGSGRSGLPRWSHILFHHWRSFRLSRSHHNRFRLGCLWLCSLRYRRLDLGFWHRSLCLRFCFNYHFRCLCFGRGSTGKTGSHLCFRCSSLRCCLGLRFGSLISDALPLSFQLLL